MYYPEMNKSIKLRDRAERSALLAEFRINGSFVLGVYQGSISEFDFLLQYKQEINGEWTKRARTPKHIHWAVDILIKQALENEETDRFLDFRLKEWNRVQPIKTAEEREKLLNVDSLMDQVEEECRGYEKLAGKGEYSLKFLLLVAKLLMIQEKTNRKDAYMFSSLLEQLKSHHGIYEAVSTATFH